MGRVKLHVHVSCPCCVETLSALRQITTLLEAIMSNQSDLDARVAQLTQIAVDTQLAVDGVQQAIDDLKAANPALDFTALDAAIGTLSAATADLQTSDPGTPGVDPTV